MFYYKEETYKINGAAMKVYNSLRHGFLEAVYQEALEMEFVKQGIPYEREKELEIYYDGKKLKQTYRADFVCYNKIIVELKAVAVLDDTHRSQVYNICVPQAIKSVYCLISAIMMDWRLNVK